MPDSRRTALAWCVVAGWLVGCLVLLWRLEGEESMPFLAQAPDPGQASEAAPSPFDLPVAEAEAWLRARRNDAGAATGRTATWFHIYDAGCSCNRYADPHVTQIRERFDTSDIKFQAVDRSELAGRAGLPWLGSTPAALVFDAAGRLVYLGPYSDSAWCGADAAYVERVLQQLLEGQQPRLQPTFARGCYCQPQRKS